MHLAAINRSCLTQFLLAMWLAGCASESETTETTPVNSPVFAARSQLSGDLKKCTATYGYDPYKTTGMPEHGLAPNELPWRQCAYDAVHDYEQANPAMAAQYQQLVAEDISMTTAMQQGTMTRTQRKTRLEELLEQIRAGEEKQIQADAAAQEEQSQQVRDLVEGFRGFAR
ncbi:MAG: hypothetical protein E6Q98_07765 [Rhodospirillaceae bacterium]|nr:MAG: hypothetical protein E6Q98_07765 [Rhodospirillaceae bacterium]